MLIINLLTLLGEQFGNAMFKNRMCFFFLFYSTLFAIFIIQIYLIFQWMASDEPNKRNRKQQTE